MTDTERAYWEKMAETANSLTTPQDNALYSLWIHCRCDSLQTPEDFQFHAERLDRLQVPWTLQNHIAGAGYSGKGYAQTIRALQNQEYRP